MLFHLLGTNGFHTEAENERFTAAGSGCRHTETQIGSLRIDVFCSTTPFGHVISRVAVLQKLEFTILCEHDDDVVGVRQISCLFLKLNIKI